MNEFKGTKGNWHVGGLENGKLSINTESYFIALIDQGSEQRANACLIAAAPDLLISLQQIIASANRLGLVSDDDSGLSLEVSKAEFYINKALGK